MSLKEKSISGAKWNTISSINQAIIQVLKVVILAHIISKSDFGIMAIALMIVGFTEIFANMGFEIGILHKQDITQNQYSSIFWLNLILSFFLFSILWGCTPLFARYYNEPLLLTIIPLVGLRMLFSAFGKIFLTFKNKEMNFKFIAIVRIIAVETGAIVTVLMAFNGLGVYSLVYGFILQTFLIQTIFALSGIRKYRIRFYCNLREIKDFIKIGSYQLGTQVMEYLSSKIDVLIIGRFFGLEILGVYNIAKDLIDRILTIVNPVITLSVTPAFAMIQEKLELMKTKYLFVLKMVLSIDFPVFVILAIFAEPVTLLMYGHNMMDIAHFLRLFAICGFITCISNPASVLIVALGRTDLGFILTVIRIICTAIAISIAAYFSVQAVIWAQVVVAFFLFFLYWKLTIYQIAKIPFKDYCKAFSKTFIFSLIPLLLPFTCFFLSISNNIFSFLLIFIYVICFLMLHIIFDRSFVKEILTMLSSQLSDKIFPSLPAQQLNYLFYKLTNGIENIKLEEDYSIQKIKPYRDLHDIMWMLFSFFKYTEYQILYKTEVVATAQVMPRIFIFSFMKKGDIHIGPCFTHPNFRGRNLYPFLIKHIYYHHKTQNNAIYIFTTQDNIASQKGIEKAAGKLIGRGNKNWLGVYKIIELYE